MRFFCFKCNKAYKDFSYYCECGAPLQLKTKKIKKKLLNGINISHKKYERIFPFKIISIGEGGTSLVSFDKNIFLKLEYINPTGSFKDRGSSVEIGYAIHNRFKSICLASTGNMAISLASYASYIGLETNIFLTRKVDKYKLNLLRMMDVKIVGFFDSYIKAFNYCENYAKNKGIFLAGDYALRLEGQKTISYEIFEQLGEVPDIIVLPIGNGTLFSSIHKGFEEIGEVPKIIGVVAKGCNSLYKTFKTRSERLIPIKKSKTIATAIACEKPVWGEYVLRLCYEYGHEILEISDEKMLEAQKLLAKKGFFVEISSASVLAALKIIRDKIENKEKVVLVLTGSRI